MQAMLLSLDEQRTPSGATTGGDGGPSPSFDGGGAGSGGGDGGADTGRGDDASSSSSGGGAAGPSRTDVGGLPGYHRGIVSMIDGGGASSGAGDGDFTTADCVSSASGAGDTARDAPSSINGEACRSSGSGEAGSWGRGSAGGGESGHTPRPAPLPALHRQGRQADGHAAGPSGSAAQDGQGTSDFRLCPHSGSSLPEGEAAVQGGQRQTAAGACQVYGDQESHGQVKPERCSSSHQTHPCFSQVLSDAKMSHHFDSGSTLPLIPASFATIGLGV